MLLCTTRRRHQKLPDRPKILSAERRSAVRSDALKERRLAFWIAHWAAELGFRCAGINAELRPLSEKFEEAIVNRVDRCANLSKALLCVAHAPLPPAARTSARSSAINCTATS